MAWVKDLWTKKNPNKDSRTKRVRSARWGIGKRWMAVWIEDGREVGETFETRDAAELFASQVDVGQDDGTWITKDKRSVTLRDMWESWIASKAGKSKKTIDGYKSAWGPHIEPVWGDTPCHEIDRAKVSAWLPTLRTTQGCKAGTDRPLGSAQQRKIGIIINALLAQAEDLSVIHKNPIRTDDVPRQKKAERRYLKVREVDALLAAAPTEAAGLLAEVLVMTGVRPGEAKGFKVKDLDVDRGRLRVSRDVDDLGNPDETKTRNHRDVPIGGGLLLDLEDAAEGCDPEDWLIADEYGNVWTTARWRRVWAKMCEQAGLTDVTTYVLKHTAASMAIASGADAKKVQRMLGHGTAAMTLDVYGHLWDTGLDDVPTAIESHMAAEREKDKAREKARSERRARRGHLRAVRDEDAG